MQTANIQLSVAIKSTTPAGSNSTQISALGQSKGSGGFDNWMQEASNRPAQFDRSDSKALPQGGSDLPAREAKANESTQARQVSEEDSPAVAATTESKPDSEAVSEAQDVSSPADTAEQESPDESSAEQNIQVEWVGGEQTTQDAVDTQVDSDLELQVDAGQVDGAEARGESESDAESEVSKAGEAESVAGVVTPEAVPSASEEGQGLAVSASQNAAQSQGQSNLVDESEIVSREAVERPENTPRASGRGGADTPPPGALHASDQGIAHGRPFESLRNTQSPQDVAADTIDGADAVEDAELEQSLSRAQPSVQEGVQTVQEELDVDAELPQDTLSVVTADGQNSESVDPDDAASVNASVSPEESELDPLLAEQSQEQRVSTSENAAVAASAPNAAPAESRAPTQVVSPATASPERVEANSAVPAGSSGSTGQQSSSDGQSGRQALADQLAQTGTSDKPVEKAAEGRSSGAQSDAQTAPKLAAGVSVTAEASARVVTPQSAAVSAVPSQAFSRMQQPQWGQKLGERSLMMVQHGPRVAYVQLDPPELGALQVRVHLQQGDQVSLNFTAPNAAVKEAIEQHLPRLREMFAEQGLNLAQSDVRDQSARGQGERGDGEDTGRRGQYSSGSDEAEPLFAEMSVPVGVVDYYA